MIKRLRLVAAILPGLVALAGCETATPPPPATAYAAPVSELGRSDRVVVARVQPGDTAASLAARYLNDPAQAWRVDVLGGEGLRPGSAVAIPLRPDDPGGALDATARYVPILCYHRFSAGRSTSAMQMSADKFDEQLRWLKTNGYVVVSIRRLEAFMRGEAVLPPKSVVITLDDGYASDYTVAFPLLRKYDDPFTLFIYTDFIGAGAALSWGEIDEMARSGLADVQAHSKSHVDMAKRVPGETPGAYLQRMQTEIETPEQILSARVGSHRVVFAYPYGSTNGAVVDELARDGYPLAVTVTRGGNASWSNPYLLRRDMVFGTASLEAFAAWVEAAERGAAPAGRVEHEEGP